MRTSIRTLPLPDTFSSRQAAPPPPPPQHTVTSLAQPRPGPRCTNEYVDSPRSRPSVPLKTHLQSPTLTAGGGGGFSATATNSPRLRGGFTNGGGGLHSNNNQHHHHHQQLSLHQLASSRSPHSGSLTTANTTTLTRSSTPVLVVTQQPLSKSPPLKKDTDGSPIIPLDGYGRDGDGGVHLSPNSRGVVSLTAAAGATTADGGVRTVSSQGSGTGFTHGGIICEECGKCRCGACTERRELPCGTWCCGGKCELTPVKVLDVCTCFCAVKCLFFHCRRGEEEEDDNECYENPCGCCGTPLCCQRWTVLGLMSACLPCLWTYWPARACLAASTATYNACCRHKGCQCDLKHAENASSGTSGGSASISGSSSSAATKGSVLSSIRVGGGGGGMGSAGTKNSKHSQARRLLIESDSSSA
ncbi:sprouty-like protein 2 [Plakobranchus ocellatus]|uniref:Sprouty-like protein 2 n=1 Tax=Plakobranchus ocellatus TaxID=259542 RepID=A0AAV3WY43_9GAST|nr:sprouty-like protein 2 [Plakobranchus ocellatus]